MSELNRRILSSLILICITLFALYNYYILTLISLILFIEIYNEIFLILRRILKKKIKLYFSLLLSLVYLLVLLLVIWLIITNNFSQFKLYFLAIVLICVTSDIGGYIFGKIIGGKKLTKISPNKTYSGSIGSYFFSIMFTYLIFSKYFSSEFVILYSIIISTISQIGDLMISILKRKAKIKDTGNLIPGHGGLLDRFDGLIFAIPLGLIILNFLWKKI